MRYRPFGRTGLQVSVMGFGSWPMAGDRYGSIEDEEAIKAIHRSLELGVNLVDTAPGYGAGHSEEVVGRALLGRRQDVILVTKCGIIPVKPGEVGPARNSSRENLLEEIDASLRRLQTDYVDVLLVHWPDPKTPFETTMRALEEIVEAGKARFVGLSNFTLEMLQTCMRERRVDVIQVGYHMFDRRMEREIFPWALENGVGVMGYGSLAHGLLTGAFKPDHQFEQNDWRGQGVVFGQLLFKGENLARNVGVAERIKQEVAEPRGVPLSQIALAWVLKNPAVSTALVGARNPAEVDANVAGTELELSGEEMAKIEQILRGVAGRVQEFSPLNPAQVPWGEELPVEEDAATA